MFLLSEKSFSPVSNKEKLTHSCNFSMTKFLKERILVEHFNFGSVL